ncbi:MAG: UbiA family prenyltransferase [Rubrivivax sp.]|nr:UbiA family prenyltransferase [Rubrivivax sp.]
MNAATLPDDVPRPLCVDCDGTLIRSDLLHEAVLALVKTRWWLVFALPWWLLRGRAHLKRQVARHVRLDAATLPYHEPLVAWLREERARGRRLVLATAADRSLADGVAAHLGLFDEVLASERGVNLAGAAKGRELARRFGEHGFDYAGDSRRDLDVWRHAGGAIVVGPAAGTLAAAAGGVAPLLHVFDRGAAHLADYLRALRLHQWLKNLLVLLPALSAHRIGEAATLGVSLAALLAFGLAASGVYVLNDLLDLPSDRRHARKRHRPFASGRVPVAHGAVMVPGLLAAAAAVALTLPPLFQGVLLLYLSVTTAYSVSLKNQPVVDVIVLASLYALRVLAGSAATGIQPSFWLLAFSLFLFLSLALVKRHAELGAVLRQDGQRAAGRGYEVADLVLLMALGVAAAMAAVLVLALYVHDGETARLYAEPRALWLIVPLLLFWVMRLWMITHRGGMHDDPVVFAARDSTSLAVLALVGLVMLAAQRGGWG